jgi:hypothetical protein
MRTDLRPIRLMGPDPRTMSSTQTRESCHGRQLLRAEWEPDCYACSALSIRCQRMNPHVSHENARASSPPSSACSVEWPSRRIHVVPPHIGHFRSLFTTS